MTLSRSSLSVVGLSVVGRSLVGLPLAVVALVAIAACGTDDDAGAPVPDPEPPPTTAPPTTVPAPELDGREFVSTSVEGYQLVDGSTIRLSFDDGSLSANAGCNTIFGAYRITDGTLGVDQLGTTEMACETDLMAQDRWLTDILALEPRLELEGNTLTLRGVADTVIVLLDRTEAEPDQPLQGTRWVLDGIRDGDAVSTVPDGVTSALTFDGDQVTVEAGCNRGSATVTIDDETITFGPIPLTRMMCEPDVMDVEAAVTGVLDGEVRYRIDGDRLTLDSADTPVAGDAGAAPDEPAEMGGTGLLYVATTTA